MPRYYLHCPCGRSFCYTASHAKHISKCGAYARAIAPSSPVDVLDAAEVQVRATMADGDARNRALDLLDIARGEVPCD